jgi:hypothetical protein
MAFRLEQGQILRKGIWLKRAVWVLGFAWPFVVGLFALTFRRDDNTHFSSGFAFVLLFSGLLGTPVVVAFFFRCLPERWSEAVRTLVAVLLAIPCVLVEVSLALPFCIIDADLGWTIWHWWYSMST